MRFHEQRIFNYELTPEGKQMIQMPRNAEVLGVIEKYGLPWILVAVDPQEPNEPRFFRVVTTGEIFNREDKVYVGTLRLGGEPMPNGKTEPWYTMHVFEIESATPPKHPDPVDPRYTGDLNDLKREFRDRNA